MFVALLGVLGMVALGIFAGLGLVPAHIMAMAVAFVGAAYGIGRWAYTDEDPWLPRLLVLGASLKLIGAGIRLYVLQVIYDGSGDAGLYHGYGVSIAKTWRALNVPDIATVGFGSEGTRFIAWLTGLFYAPYEPSMLGGFWIYSFLAFVGQIFFYLAFRVALPRHQHRKYALAMFLWPSFIYWPSSIGKEPVLMLFLGLGAWAAAHLYETYGLRWFPLVGFAALGVFMVRAHVAALLVGAVLAGAIFAKRRPGVSVASRRLLIATVGLLAVPILASGVGERFGLEGGSFTVDDLDMVVEDVGERTEQGGSAVSGGVVRSPVDLPAGALKVLVRPLPHEAGNAQMLAASAEGLLLLGLLLWRLPGILGNFSSLRSSPYLMMSAAFTVVFIWAWSAILNLGIIARQRSLVLPFVLALIIGLGWDERNDESAATEANRARARALAARVGSA